MNNITKREIGYNLIIKRFLFILFFCFASNVFAQQNLQLLGSTV